MTGRNRLTTLFLILILSIVSVFIFYLLKSTYFGGDQEKHVLDIENDRPDMVLEPFEYSTYDKQGRKVLSIKAEKLKGFLRANTYALAGIQEAVFWQDDGSTATISAEQGVFQEDTKDISLSGKVRISLQQALPGEFPLLFQADDLKYKDVTGIFETDGPVTMRRKDTQVSGRGMRLQRREQIVTLESDVSTEFRFTQREGDPGIPINVRSSRARYEHEAGRLEYHGDVRIDSPPHTITTDQMIVFLGDPEKRIECTGNVEGKFERIQIPDSAELEREFVDLKADRLSMFQATGLVRCEGNVVAKEKSRRLECEELEMYYSEDVSKIAALTASGNVRIEDGAMSGNADRALYSLLSDRMMLSGNPVVRTETDEISGREMIIFPERKQYFVIGSVNGYFVPRQGSVALPQMKKTEPSENLPPSQQLIAFSAARCSFNRMTGMAVLEENVTARQGTQAIYTDRLEMIVNQDNEIASLEAKGHVKGLSESYNATTDRLSYSADKRLANLEGNCRMWQGESSIRSPRMVVFTEREMVQALDGVSMHLAGSSTPQRGARGQSAQRSLFGGSPIDITAESALYQKEISRAVFDGSVHVVKSGRADEAGNLTCEHMQIDFDPESERIRQFEATGDVSMTQHVQGGLRSATGDSAVYNGSEDVLTLSGRKVTISDPSNVIECTVAHFHLTENYYVIDGPQTQSIHYPDGRTEGSEEGKGNITNAGQPADREGAAGQNRSSISPGN